MNRTTLLNELFVAVGLTLITALLVLFWPLLTAIAIQSSSVVMVITLLYCGYRLIRSEHRAGTFSLATVALLSLMTIWAIDWSDQLLLISAIGVIWGIRSWTTYRRPLPTLLDLLLTLSALAAALWAFSINGIIAAVWCFFLLEALCVLIPQSSAQPSDDTAINDDDSNARFNQAHRNAETALRALICREELE